MCPPFAGTSVIDESTHTHAPLSTVFVAVTVVFFTGVFLKNQKRLEKIADTVTRSESRNSALARLNGFWEVFDKDDSVLIIISADPDALASALAVKRLLRYRVQNVTIGYPNEIRRLNNLEMVKRLRIP